MTEKQNVGKCGAEFHNPVANWKCDCEKGHEGAHHDRSYPMFDCVWTKQFAGVIRL